MALGRGMAVSDATYYLTAWIAKVSQRALSITRTARRYRADSGASPHFKPGIASYGWESTET
jgi:hypothetical protein